MSARRRPFRVLRRLAAIAERCDLVRRGGVAADVAFAAECVARSWYGKPDHRQLRVPLVS